MAIARVHASGAASTYTATAALTSFACAFTAATAGNILIATVVVDKTAGTFNTPAGWTQIASVPGASVSVWVGYKVAAGGEASITFTWTTAATTATGYVLEYSGASTTLGPNVVPVYSDTAGTTKTITSSTSSASGVSLDLVVGGIDTVTTATGFNIAATGFTLGVGSYIAANTVGSGQPGFAYAEKAATAASTTEAPVFTWTDSDQTTLILIRLVTASTASGDIMWWSGSAWVAKPVMWWSGSAWVKKPVEYWGAGVWTVTKY